MAHVTVNFMGDFADLGCSSLKLDVADFYDLVTKVCAHCPPLRKFLLNGTEVRTDFLAFCRGKVVSDPEATFQDGDVITLYPPVTL